MGRVLRWALFAATAMLFTPSHALAAKYDVYGCHGPSGQVVGVDGWSSELSAAGIVYQGCATLGYFGAGVTLDAAHRDGYGKWSFESPDGTAISDFTLYRSARSVGGDHWVKGYGLFYNGIGYDSSHLIESCYVWWGCNSLGRYLGGEAAPNAFGRYGLRAHKLVAVAHCVGAGTDCRATPTIRGRFDIYQSRIGLSDPFAPVFLHDPSGSLFAGGPVSGTSTASFGGSDRGGGLYRVGVDIDGSVYGSQPVEPSVTSCARPVTTPVPCPLGASGTYTFATRWFPDGPHTVRLALTDIAGNTTYSRPETVTFRNHARPNGLGASRDVRLRAGFGRHLARYHVSRFGRRPTVRGRLRRGDRFPIPGATVRILSRAARTGSRYRVVGHARTNADGRFRFRLPKGPSRRLRVAYRAYDLDATDAATRGLALDVHAGVRLKIRPRAVRNGHRIAFRGRLRGGPGRKGALITLQETAPRPLTFKTIHADRHGRFHASYRFRYTYRRSLFRFRALVQRQAGYPYLGGRSRSLRVVVTP